MEGSLLSRFFVTTMEGSLVIMEGSLLSRFFLIQWMVALSLCKVVCCRDFYYSNGWYPQTTLTIDPTLINQLIKSCNLLITHSLLDLGPQTIHKLKTLRSLNINSVVIRGKKT